MSLTGWVPPEALPPEPARSVASSSAVEHAAADDAPLSIQPVPRPVPLRPLTVADILDGAFAIITARPRTIFAICATFVIPLVALQALLTPDGLTTGALEGAFGEADSDASASNLVFLYFLLDSMMLPFVAAGIAHVVAAWYAGSGMSARTAIGRVLRRSWVLLVAWAASHALQLLGLLMLVVGSLLFMAMFVAVAPVVAIEGRGPFASLGRSQKLCSKRLFAVLWIAVLTGVVSMMIGTILPLLAEAIVALVGDRFGWLLYGSAAVLARLISTPFVAAAAVLVYLDLRVRYEGLDLELTLADRARAT